MMKVERIAKYNEHKYKIKDIWTTKMENEFEIHDGESVPSHFKCYSIQDRNIIVQQPIRIL